MEKSTAQLPTPTAALQGAPGESMASRFYTARRMLYDTTKTPSGPPQGTFHPNHLEYTLDDNYHTRMICGPPAHDHPIPIRPEHTACALQNLDREYLFVGITERYQVRVGHGGWGRGSRLDQGKTLIINLTF
jgi:hypothetical protein